MYKLGSPKLGSHANLDFARQLDDTFGTGNAYAITNIQGSFFLSGKQKEKIANKHLQAGYVLPQAARWKAASEREVASLEKHGVYKLTPIISVSTGQRVIGTR